MANPAVADAPPQSYKGDGPLVPAEPLAKQPRLEPSFDIEMRAPEARDCVAAFPPLPPARPLALPEDASQSPSLPAPPSVDAVARQSSVRAVPVWADPPAKTCAASLAPSSNSVVLARWCYSDLCFSSAVCCRVLRGIGWLDQVLAYFRLGCVRS